MNLLEGMRIIENRNLTIREQVRFPRSKKKRIRKKWRKNPGNWARRPSDDVYFFNNTFVMHPATAARLRSIISSPFEELPDEEIKWAFTMKGGLP